MALKSCQQPSCIKFCLILPSTTVCSTPARILFDKPVTMTAQIKNVWIGLLEEDACLDTSQAPDFVLVAVFYGSEEEKHISLSICQPVHLPTVSSAHPGLTQP